MSNVVMGQVQELADPKLEEIAKRVYHTFCLAAEKAVAHENAPAQFPMPADAGALENFFLNRFRQLHPDRQKIASIKMMPGVNAPAANRKKMYKNLATVNLKASESVEKQVAMLTTPAHLKMDLDYLQKLPFAGGLLPVETTSQVSAGSIAQAPLKKLGLRISRVKCVDETGGSWTEWAGDDEIYLGGTATDETGDTNKITAFKVGDFNDGTAKDYNPPKQFMLFDTTEGTVWPKSYFVTLVLAEKDNGGLPDFINNLTEKVKSKVTEYLIALAGGAIGSIGGPVGAAIGAATAKVVSYIIDFLIAAWNDDVFPPQTISISIPFQGARFNGQTVTETKVVAFKGHGGHYRLAYNWRLSN